MKDPMMTCDGCNRRVLPTVAGECPNCGHVIADALPETANSPPPVADAPVHIKSSETAADEEKPNLLIEVFTALLLIVNILLSLGNGSRTGL